MLGSEGVRETAWVLLELASRLGISGALTALVPWISLLVGRRRLLLEAVHLGSIALGLGAQGTDRLAGELVALVTKLELMR